MKVLDCAKLPYQICKGSVKDRTKLAENMLQNFVESVEKDFKNSDSINFYDIFDKIDSAIPVNNIFFNVKRERPDVNYMDFIPDRHGQLKSYKIGLETDSLLQFDKINKNSLYHEVWHLYDAITNPKYGSRGDFCFSKQYVDYLEYYDEFFYTKTQYNKRTLKTKLEEMLSLVKEEEKIDMLQLLRYSLIREYSAYKIANKYASDCGEYKKYNFPQKIRLVSKKLSQTIKEFRSNLCNR